MDWTLEQLRALAAIAEHGTMTAAAHELGYTTGAVSQQMRSLRGVVGRDLFVKEGRGLALTDAGHVVLRHAQRILKADQAARDALRGPDAGLGLGIRLGVFGSAGVVAVRALVERLDAIAPGLEVRALEVDVERMPEAVAMDEVDVALGIDYHAVPLPPARGIVVRRLRREPFRLAIPRRLRGRCVDPDERRRVANAEPWILPPPSSFFGRATRLACGAAGVEPRVRHLVTDTAVSLAMVDSGLGLTLATPLMARLWPQEGVLTAALPGAGGRDIVAYAKQASLERESVALVVRALGDVFDRTGATPAVEGLSLDVR